MSLKKFFIIGLCVMSIMMLSSCSENQNQNTNNEASDELTGTQENLEQNTFTGLSEFEATDINGNDVNQDIFKDYDLTMVNIWATFCNPCLDEMPHLGEIYNDYEDKGLNIIGIVVDVFDNSGNISNDQIETAKEVIEKTKANYTHLLPSKDLINLKLKDVMYFPETFFVDKDGNIVGESIIGARNKDEWIEIIDKHLKEIQ